MVIFAVQTRNMIKIYHNNRCSKSREGLAILENSDKKIEIINYLENPPTKDELKAIIRKLGISPIQLVRKNEKVWKENFKNKELSDNDLIEAMTKYPKLIERPIVVSGDKAILGRPPENILQIL